MKQRWLFGIIIFMSLSFLIGCIANQDDVQVAKISHNKIIKLSDKSSREALTILEKAIKDLSLTNEKYTYNEVIRGGYEGFIYTYSKAKEIKVKSKTIKGNLWLLILEKKLIVFNDGQFVIALKVKEFNKEEIKNLLK
ncbi:hypothetical protein Tfer_2717 [Thermincola ferriacetica]|uniref:Lipoprotein n=1 Tax=Thermincola ferriacetica TaxID=281456 RepID=A0A0L6VZG8_9FIRM|nr:hypothetical protein [Thermincola ferriacetica]KNZ68722.1 hypothetical protein Tfer_2717 [Thermincola ferriacetica]